MSGIVGIDLITVAIFQPHIFVTRLCFTTIRKQGIFYTSTGINFDVFKTLQKEDIRTAEIISCRNMNGKLSILTIFRINFYFTSVSRNSIITQG